MAESLKIKVTIAGRVYPMTIKNENEEEGMRKAANMINELVTKFEKNYAVSDKQDVLRRGCGGHSGNIIHVESHLFDSF